MDSSWGLSDLLCAQKAIDAVVCTGMVTTQEQTFTIRESRDSLMSKRT
jgi:hypothetical protein